MKKATIVHLTFRLFIAAILLPPLLLPAEEGRAQDSAYEEPSPGYSREELAQLLAPVALYPDALLSQVLMAATYPIEVIEADRWVKRNPPLQGDALDDALLAEDWDPSVKAICHFPTVLALMSEHIAETTSLGNAFLAQEGEVMAMVQELRHQAYVQGNLTSNAEQTVVVERETIIIEPALPRVIYVPYYDPFVVYGSWWYPDYPPYYWVPSGVRIGIGISYWPGVFFEASYLSWSYFDWPQRVIIIDVHQRPRYVRHDRWLTRPGHWQHAPSHRRGVAYRDKFTARRFGQTPAPPREVRRNVRGYPDRADGGRRIDTRVRTDHDQRGTPERRIESDRQNRERRREQPGAVVRKTDDERRRAPVKIDRVRPEPQPDQRREDRATKVKRERQVTEEAGKREERSRDTVFDRVEDGRRERESSERGRISRQGRNADDRDGRDRKGTRDDRDRRGK